MFSLFKQIRKINNSKLSQDEWYGKDENGRGIIDVGAENYEDIFSFYNLEGENVLDWEFVDFLERKADAIPLKEEIALHFYVKDANSSKKEEVEDAIKRHYKREVRANHRKLHRNTLTCIYLLFMGLIAFGIYIPLTIFNVYFVVPYIFDLIAWVFLWETVDNFFIKRRGIKHNMLKQFRFIRADVDVYEQEDKKNRRRK